MATPLKVLYWKLLINSTHSIDKPLLPLTSRNVSRRLAAPLFTRRQHVFIILMDNSAQCDVARVNSQAAY